MNYAGVYKSGNKIAYEFFSFCGYTDFGISPTNRLIFMYLALELIQILYTV